MKALSRSAADRHHSAAELQDELEAYVRQRGGVSAHDLAGFMAQHFGEIRDQRRKRIEAKLANLERLPVFGARARFDGSQPTPAAPMEVGTRRRSSRPAEAPRTTYVWVGGALIAGALVTAMVMTLADGQNAAVERPSTPKPMSAPSGQQATVELRVTALPGHARLYIDGVPLPGNPYLDRVPQDGSTHIVRAEAEGHQPSTRELKYDNDVEIVLALQEVSHAEAAASAAAVASSPHAKRPAPPPARSAPRPPVPGADPDCVVPYIIDPQGIKRFKPQCI